MTLPELAIKRHVTVFMIIVSLVVMGGVALVRLPLAFMPEVERPQMFVRLPYPNAAPEQTERMVVRPVEDVLGSLPGLREMWSMCNEDGGMVRLNFDWSVNMKLARVEVWDRLDRVRRDLPDDIGDIVVSSSWDSREADKPVIEGRLSSPRNLSESYDLLERKIVRPLQRVPGVAQVRLDGVNPREVRINLDTDRLESHGVDVRNVIHTLRTSNFDQSLGNIREGDTRLSVRTVAEFATVNEIRNLPIRADGLRLGDVADVKYTEPPLEYGRHLDGHFAVGITVSQEAQANTVEVCDAVEARIAAMNSDPELQGVNFLVWFDQGQEIKKTLHDLMFTGIFGAILAAVVLFLFLRRVSSTIVSVLCIPFSLIVTCGFVWARGDTMNTLTLLGLIVGIGMLVDNAVVVIENIFRHQEMGEDQKTAARLGAREVSTAVTAATLTSVIVFLPLIFNKPTEMNIYLKELGITVCLTLLASLFISQTLIPMATYWFIRSRPRPKTRLMLSAEKRYAGVLMFMLRRRWVAPVLGFVVFASAAYPFMKIDKNFDTNESELFVQFRYNFSEEPSLKEKEQIVTRVEHVLDPHRKELMARSIYSFWSDRFTLTRVYLRKGDANADNIALVRSRLRKLLPQIPGVKLEVMENRQFWRQDRGKRVAFQLVGDDTEVLAAYAEKAKKALGEIPGLVDPFSSIEQGEQEIHVNLDRETALRLGIPPMQPAQVVGMTFRGQRMQRFRTRDGEREMRVMLDEKNTESIDQLKNVPLWTSGGEKIPLASLASFHEIPGAQHIQRDNRMTSVWVGARYDQGTREQYLPEVRRVAASLGLPQGYSWTFGRWQERRTEKEREFVTNLVLALLLVFAVMAGLFESVRQAIALLIALPFALSGAAWILWVTGTDFDQPAAVGLLLLIGIVVNNGIVMIEHINQYRRNGMERTAAMLRGGTERLRPILMTVFTTLISLVPMVIQKPSLGGVYYYSMGLVIMGGLAVSTVLTLVLLPTGVTIVEDTFAGVRRAGSWLLGMPARMARRGARE